MCGIFGYIGPKMKPTEIVIEGLKKLEYRGYDSWGIAIKTKDTIIIHKQTGKIGEYSAEKWKKIPALEAIGEVENTQEAMTIGHSRWATHGGVTNENAHPHFTENKDIVIAHNGIFENYLALKKELTEKGHSFSSETDSEVLAHLIEEEMKSHDLETATRRSLSRAEGRFAILVMCNRENKMIAARFGSPLIVGVGDEKEFFVASDIPAFLKYTNKVQYLDDNEMVIITPKGATYRNLETNEEVKKRTIEIQWTEESAEKGEYAHYMLKEIMEQKDTLYRAVNQDPEVIEKVIAAIKNAFGTYIIGCGTAGKVSMAAEYMFSKIAHKHVNTAFGSEFVNYHHFLTDRSLVIAVSQSGETADTLEALEIARKKGAKIIAIVNVETSTMARMADIVLPIKAGPEKAVASTKATTAQMAILMLLAYGVAGKMADGKSLLINVIAQINDMLNPRYEEHIIKLAEKIMHCESMYIIGRGANYPMALESAIKLQEVSYIHAEGFAGGELKHGPIALISKGTPCIVLTANDDTKKAIVSNAIEVKARGGYIIGIGPEKHEVFDYWIRVPDCFEASPLVNIIPVQILAYHLALLKKNDPDMPRNLAKSVTVK